MKREFNLKFASDRFIEYYQNDNEQFQIDYAY